MGVSINTKAQLKATTLLDVNNLSVAMGTPYNTGLTKADLSQYAFIQIECSCSASPTYYHSTMAKIDASRIFAADIIHTFPSWTNNTLYRRYFDITDAYDGNLTVIYNATGFSGEKLSGVRVIGFK